MSALNFAIRESLARAEMPSFTAAPAAGDPTERGLTASDEDLRGNNPFRGDDDLARGDIGPPPRLRAGLTGLAFRDALWLPDDDVVETERRPPDAGRDAVDDPVTDPVRWYWSLDSPSSASSPQASAAASWNSLNDAPGGETTALWVVRPYGSGPGGRGSWGRRSA
jgi:hypothetical protein